MRFALAVSALLLWSCGGAAPTPTKTPPAAHHESPAERNAKIRRWYAREVDPVAAKPVSIFDGQVAGEIESKSDIKADCQHDDGGAHCSFAADLGPDADDPKLVSTIGCSVSDTIRALGPAIKTLIDKTQLDEMPVLEVKQTGEGIAAKFVANASGQDGDNVVVGTVKIAALYAHGYMALCYDGRAGGRKTFDRVVGHFFDTLKLKSTITLFALGYQMRDGDRTSGVLYKSIAKRRGESGDEEGFLEGGVAFRLVTDGKTWSTFDFAVLAERDARGTVEKVTDSFWKEGNGPMVLSAKATEEKKFRLKVEVGDKSSGLESTPSAPINSELWAAPELARVAAGTAPKYRYAVLDLDEQDPAFAYMLITRSAPGILSEVQETKKKPAAGTPPSKNELHIDNHGIVTKEVDSTSVTELVHTWGSLPVVVSKKK